MQINVNMLNSAMQTHHSIAAEIAVAIDHVEL